MFSKISWVLIISLIVVTRIIGVNWGAGYYFHPDENNMATSVAQMSSDNLDPHFYAYGQFPLHTAFFGLKVLGIPNNFPNSILALRIQSLIYGLLFLYCLYLIYPSRIFLLMVGLSPGIIQLSHFGTTENLLMFVFAYNLFLSKIIISRGISTSHLIMSSIVNSIGISSKISSLIFLCPLGLAYLYRLIKHRQYIYILFGIFFILITTLLTSLLSAQSIYHYSDFISSMNYETGVAIGSIPVFYTQQFAHINKYLFQLIHIFPYANGYPILILGIIGFLFFLSKKNIYTIFNLNIALGVLIYFLYFGSLYVAWFRFMSPLFFVLPLMASKLINKIKYQILKYFVVFISILPGLIFFTSAYLTIDTRIQATNFIEQNIPENSIVLSEGGNVINLPVSTSKNLKVYNYDFYRYNPETAAPELAKLLVESDYIIVPSRRVFKNYDFTYHHKLFSGHLGFELIYQTNLLDESLGLAETAEETWTVFDRPIVRIYRKINPLTYEDYLKALGQ